MKKFIVFLFAAYIFSSCSSEEKTSASATSSDSTPKVINVHTSTYGLAEKAVFKKFTADTGIEINVTEESDDILIKNMQLEETRTPADVILLQNAIRLDRAQQRGVLKPFSSEILTNLVPQNHRDSENYWTGISKTAILCVGLDETPPSFTYQDLAKSKYRNNVFLTAPRMVNMLALYSQINGAEGSEAMSAMITGLQKNLGKPCQGNDYSQFNLIQQNGSGWSFVNSHVYYRLLNSGSETQQNMIKNIKMTIPNQNSSGYAVNIFGGGLSVNCANEKGATEFLEYLVSEEAQNMFMTRNYVMPINSSVELHSKMSDLKTAKESDFDLNSTLNNSSSVLNSLNEIGWK